MSLDNTAEVDFSDVDADAATFLRDLMGMEDEPKKEAPKAAEPDTEADVETSDEVDESASEQASEGETEADTEADGDDPEVTFKIGDAETKVRMSELRTLVEQRETTEARFKAVEETREKFNAGVEKAHTALTAMLQRAQEKWKPYAELDWVTTRTQVDDATWEQLRKMAGEAQAEVKFLEAELDQTVTTAREAATQHARQAAAEAIKVLEAPPEKGGIEGFGPKLYGEMIDYAATAGVPREIALQMVDPAALRLLHKAMLYDRSQAAKQTAAAKIKAAPAKPSSVASPSAKGSPKPSVQSSRATEALAKLRKTGALDDAEAAFLADLSSDRDD